VSVRSKRVEILLEPAELEALRRHAKKTKKSVGALIREAVKEKLLMPTQKTGRKP
jgi:Ribbon-helix-helix protein, copG family